MTSSAISAPPVAPHPAAPTTPCDYAACTRPGKHHADGWNFCGHHLNEHQALVAGHDLPDLKLPKLAGPEPSTLCGTASAARRHYRRGEKVCDACRIAERIDKRERAQLARAKRQAALHELQAAG